MLKIFFTFKLLCFDDDELLSSISNRLLIPNITKHLTDGLKYVLWLNCVSLKCSWNRLQLNLYIFTRHSSPHVFDTVAYNIDKFVYVEMKTQPRWKMCFHRRKTKVLLSVSEHEKVAEFPSIFIVIFSFSQCDFLFSKTLETRHKIALSNVLKKLECLNFHVFFFMRFHFIHNTQMTIHWECLVWCDTILSDILWAFFQQNACHHHARTSSYSFNVFHFLTCLFRSISSFMFFKFLFN